MNNIQICFLYQKLFQIISSLYTIGDPSTIGLLCEHGMNAACKDSMPNGTFPKKIVRECEGQLLFATENDPSCDLCKTKTSARALKTSIRRGWTQFVK